MVDTRARESYASIVALLRAQGFDAQVVLFGVSLGGEGSSSHGSLGLRVGTDTGGFALWAISDDHWAFSYFENDTLVRAVHVREVSADLLPAAVSQIMAIWPYDGDDPDEAMAEVKRLWTEGVSE